MDACNGIALEEYVKKKKLSPNKVQTGGTPKAILGRKHRPN